MDCFKCKLLFTNINHLFLHFKHNHKLQPVDHYKCIVGNCGRIFGNSKSFRKHLHTLHSVNTVSKESLNNSHSTAELNGDTFNDGNIDSNELSGADKKVLPNPEVKSIDLNASTALFLSFLYNNNNIPRNVVTVYLEHLDEFLHNLFPIIEEKFESETKDLESSATCLERLKTILQQCNPFDDLKTEYKQFEYLKKHTGFTLPEEYIIGHECKKRKVGDRISFEPQNIYVKYVSMTKTLTTVLNIPGMLTKIQDYVAQISKDNSGKVQNYIQSEHWQKKISNNKNKTIYPLFLYSDDFECGNALGSHAGVNKICGVYYSIPCMPSELRSSLSHIFVAALFYSNDRKKYG